MDRVVKITAEIEVDDPGDHNDVDAAEVSRQIEKVLGRKYVVLGDVTVEEV